ncbi:type II secretion system protein GspL [Thiomonas sp.]|uniref:type II secretion system protein GspL n=1 Tax=Thiomonas sp. TaxID=2047785 RepID=UPI00258624FE|nr:type II secretion system protein GspL [Thiomonas sp.]
MNTLVVRLAPGSKQAALDYALLGPTGAVAETGQSQPALLPRAQRVVGVWPAEQLTLLGVNLPAMPGARLQAALAGTLEDRLLTDPAAQHLAAGPREADGSVRMACACERAAIAAALQTLTQAGRDLAAVVPEPVLLAPGEAWLQAMADGLRLLWRDAEGEAAWLHLPSATQPGAQAPDLLTARLTRVLVEPALLDLATGWFGATADIVPATAPQMLARAAQSPWNLRQFDLAPQAAMQRGMAGLAKQFKTPAWRRAAMLGGVLAVIQIVGINLDAMKLRNDRSQLQTQVQTVVSNALPGAPAVLDARLQMQRALDTARARAGKPTSTSLEVLMGSAARVLPANTAIAKLDYSTGKLQLGLGTAQMQPALTRCALLGLSCSAESGQFTVRTPS